MSLAEIAVKALTEAETEALAEALAGAVMGYSFERLIEGLVEVLFEALEGMDGRVWSVEEAEQIDFSNRYVMYIVAAGRMLQKTFNVSRRTAFFMRERKEVDWTATLSRIEHKSFCCCLLAKAPMI